MSNDKIFGTAKDGTQFDAESPEVIEYLEKYPDVTLEAAIGSVIMNYEKSLTENSKDEDEGKDDQADEE